MKSAIIERLCSLRLCDNGDDVLSGNKTKSPHSLKFQRFMPKKKYFHGEFLR